MDLDRLERERRLIVEEAFDPIAAGWDAEEGVRFEALRVRLELQLAGPAVVGLGEIAGEVRLACRRCLGELTASFREDVALAYQAGVDAVEAERREVYVLPARGRELDLTEAVREHVLLAVPRFPLCREACQGLCPRCGVNLNQTACACETAEPDARWGPLRRLTVDG